MPKGLSLADFKAVLFDVDGTLVDTLPALIKGLGDSYQHFNGVRPSDEQIRALIGWPLREQMKLFRDVPPSESDVQRMVDYTIDRFEENKSSEREYLPAIEAMRLCVEQGYKTALVTSKSSREAGSFLQRYPWAQCVDTIVCSSDVKKPKPDPESALLACTRLGASPGESVFIGDSVFDMQCAHGAGVATVAVTYGSGEKTALVQEAPDAMFNSPEELLEWAKGTIYRTPCLERS
jgi:HAD superfamily hydrolase (TIGR01509 family)